MTVAALQILAYAQRYVGLPYIMGAEADLDPNGPDPEALDCSELIQVACSRNGVTMPDGHWNQWALCRHEGTLIPVEEAVETAGALLFFYDGTTEGHVAFSQGDGTTFEARGKNWGVGSWQARRGFFNYGALIPGVLYGISPDEFNPTSTPTEEDPFMTFTAQELAKAIVQEFMDHEEVLEDGKSYRMGNIIGFGNNIGNSTVKALGELDADFDRAEARESAEDAQEAQREAQRQVSNPPTSTAQL